MPSIIPLYLLLSPARSPKAAPCHLSFTLSFLRQLDYFLLCVELLRDSSLLTRGREITILFIIRDLSFGKDLGWDPIYIQCVQ